MSFGEKLKQLRNDKNLTQDQLAEKLIVSRQTVSKWELGVNQPDIETLNKLADFFEVSVDELIGAGANASNKPTAAKQLYVYNLFFNVFCALAIIVTLVFLQNPMPVHWNLHGEIDRYGSKFEVLLHLLTYVVMSAATFLLYRASQSDAKPKHIAAALITLLCVDAAYLVFALVLHGKYLKEDCLLRFLQCLCGCLMFTVGLAMHPKFTPQNGLLGVRTKLTLASVEAWNKVNAAACYLLSGAALIHVTLNFVFAQPLVSYLSILVYVPFFVAVAVYHHCVAKKINAELKA